MSQFQPDEPEVAFNKAFALRVISRVDQHVSFATDQVGSWAKWLTASLLAINGAGALASLNAASEADNSWIAGVIFAVGILAALLSGVAMQEVYNMVPEPMLEQDDYWTVVSITGARDSEREDVLRSAASKASRLAILPPLLGWISGCLFLAGIVTLGLQVAQHAAANEQQCATLKRDMLSPNQKNSRSLELYKALGCGA